ncbi:MAG: hypothetical protein PHV36_14630 [Elusimicrobiales bacterium]|nr:hypothetical protein [Elusimicrobiales bacterium]
MNKKITAGVVLCAVMLAAAGYASAESALGQLPWADSGKIVAPAASAPSRQQDLSIQEGKAGGINLGMALGSLLELYPYAASTTFRPEYSEAGAEIVADVRIGDNSRSSLVVYFAGTQDGARVRAITVKDPAFAVKGTSIKIGSTYAELIKSGLKLGEMDGAEGEIFVTDSQAGLSFHFDKWKDDPAARIISITVFSAKK